MPVSILSQPAYLGLSKNELVWSFNAPAGTRVVIESRIETGPYTDTWITLPEQGIVADKDGQVSFDLAKRLGEYLDFNAPSFFDISTAVAEDTCRRYQVRYKEGTDGVYSAWEPEKAVLLAGLPREYVGLSSGIPGTPTLLTATSDPTGVLLAFVDQSGGTAKHQVWISQLGPGEGFTQLIELDPGDVDHTHDTAILGTQYWYYIVAVRNGQTSEEFSNIATVVYSG